MTEKSRIDEIRRWLADSLGGLESEVGDEDPLLGEILDSMGVLTLAGHLEVAYGISIAAHEMDPANFGTLKALSDFVARKIERG